MGGGDTWHRQGCDQGTADGLSSRFNSGSWTDDTRHGRGGKEGGAEEEVTAGSHTHGCNSVVSDEDADHCSPSWTAERGGDSSFDPHSSGQEVSDSDGDMAD